MFASLQADVPPVDSAFPVLPPSIHFRMQRRATIISCSLVLNDANRLNGDWADSHPKRQPPVQPARLQVRGTSDERRKKIVVALGFKQIHPMPLREPIWDLAVL
jgi:hypothetical protein